MGSPPASAAPPSPSVKTYHCPCADLLFATTTPLPSLPKRKTDSSTILPLVPEPTPLSSSDDPSPHFATLHSPLAEYVFDPSSSALTAPAGPGAANGSKGRDGGALESAVVVSLEDGFEKRYLLRCKRCEGPWGYLLDWGIWEDGAKKEARREDVVFVLKGAVVETGDIGKG
ncbi:hypothetical protein C1H76_1065 [Elsinoe australis]|uniref:STEEP1 domain-containing protein n=1 Tax=Elsinoe australis TaxID=40998 RepID=A0A4U7B566_9PEZI|nr:hypothetical protein C1H76_1065 [Elsinoe australis]